MEWEMRKKEIKREGIQPNYCSSISVFIHFHKCHLSQDKIDGITAK